MQSMFGHFVRLVYLTLSKNNPEALLETASSTCIRATPARALSGREREERQVQSE